MLGVSEHEYPQLSRRLSIASLFLSKNSLVSYVLREKGCLSWMAMHYGETHSLSLWKPSGPSEPSLPSSIAKRQNSTRIPQLKNNLLSAANGYKYNVSEPFLLHWFAAGRSSSSRYPVHLAVRSVHSAIFWNRINEKLCSFFCFFFFFSFCSIYFSKTLPFFSLVPFVSMAAMLSFHFPTKHSTE